MVKNADNNELLSEYNVGRNYYYTNPDVTEGWPRRGITFFTVQYRNNGSDYINVTTDYDLFGNKVEEKIDGRAGGITYDTATTKYRYDYVGNLLTQQEPNLVNADSAEFSVQNVYNALGNIVKTTNINKKSATNEYNTTTGLLSKSTDFNGNATSYTYNCFNQLYTETLPTGGKQINYYDVNGNVAKVDTLRESNVYDSVRYVYDSRNRNIAVIGNDGEKDVVTQYEYDAVGNRTKLVQGLEEVSDLNKLSGKDYSMNTYKYNYRNQCISATDAMGQTQTYEYDLFGNVLKSVDRNGDTISYAYTPLGHLTSVNSSKDNTSISYLYDKLGNRISMTDMTGTTNYRYNTYNQLVKETKGSVVKDYTYDLNGNQISFKITDNGKVTLDETYSYNNLNQVSGITAADITANFTYDSNGNMLTYRRNGISTSYTYNSVNMPTSVTTNKGSVRYEKDTMTYYLNGNKKTTNDVNNNTTTYIYDGLGRLSSEKNTDGYSALYSYDNYGNRIEKAVDDGDNSQNVCYTYDKNNRLTSETFAVQGGQETNRYFYDANGNQTYKNIEKSIISTQKGYSLQLNDSGNGTEYEYDGLNRLVKADDGTSVATYTYDGNNLRQSKTVNGITTQHIYNGMNVVQEKERNSLKATYHRADNQIIYSEVNGSKNFYVYNAQGNVSKLVNTAGETVSDYTFDAFGVQRTVNGDVYNPFRHNGEYYDEELGYTYLRNRYYDNASGRFISEDPVRDGGNWYSYCNSNPVNYVDYFGLRYYNAQNDTEEDIQKGMETDPIAIIDGESIEIRVKISFTYNDFELEGLKEYYKEKFIEGVQNVWGGDFDYKEVQVNLIDVSDYPGMKSIQVNLYGTEGVSMGYVGEKINIYTGDSRHGISYREEGYKNAAGHEFGHVLGLGDAYDNGMNSEETTMNNNFPSVMGSMWGEVWSMNNPTGEGIPYHAQNIDYHMMLRAQDPNGRYYNNKKFIYPGHNGRDLLKGWIPNWEEYINGQTE